MDRCFQYNYGCIRWINKSMTSGHWVTANIGQLAQDAFRHVSVASTGLITWAGIKPEPPLEVSALISQCIAHCSHHHLHSPCCSSTLILQASRANRAWINCRWTAHVTSARWQLTPSSSLSQSKLWAKAGACKGELVISAFTSWHSARNA